MATLAPLPATVTAPVLAPGLLEQVREKLATLHSDLDPHTVAATIREVTGGVVGDLDLLHTVAYLREELCGLGALRSLARLAGVSDILVVAPDRVFVDRGQGSELSDVTFPDEAAVRRLAVRLAQQCGRRLDDAQPHVDGVLSGALAAPGVAGIRLHAIIPPVSWEHTSISLRLLRPATLGFSELAAGGMFPDDVAATLHQLIAEHRNFLIAGGTGSGKTTLLAALLGLVHPLERVICIEDTAELSPAHPHVVRLVTRAANLEGRGEVTAATLVRQTLRMRPDRLIVGELRGSEIVDLLAALNTGHRGGAGTIHANGLAEIPARIEALGALGGYSAATMAAQVAAAIDCVIMVARRNGQRQVTAIGELTAVDSALQMVPQWEAAQ